MRGHLTWTATHHHTPHLLLCCCACCLSADRAAGEGDLPAGLWQEGRVQQLHQAASCSGAAAGGHSGVSPVAVCCSISQQHQAATSSVQPCQRGRACLMQALGQSSCVVVFGLFAVIVSIFQCEFPLCCGSLTWDNRNWHACLLR